MKTKPQIYTAHFIINRNQRVRKFEDIEGQAEQIFNEFLGNKKPGKKIKQLRFDIYVEPQVNYNFHQDAVYMNYARLSAHIDNTVFDNADNHEKVRLVLNCALILLRYLAQKVVLPADFDANNFVLEYQKYLFAKALLLDESQSQKAIIKFFDTTRFNFIITQTLEVKDGDIAYDLVDIENYINIKLAGQTFGDSIRSFKLGYEIFDFLGVFSEFRKATANLRRYSPKYKYILVVKQFDHGPIKYMNKNKQYELLKGKILEAVSDVNGLKKRPKDFDIKKFYETIDSILLEYENKQYQNKP